MSIHHIHDFEILTELNAKFTNLASKKWASVTAYVYALADRKLKVLGKCDKRHLKSKVRNTHQIN